MSEISIQPIISDSDWTRKPKRFFEGKWPVTRQSGFGSIVFMEDGANEGGDEEEGEGGGGGVAEDMFDHFGMKAAAVMAAETREAAAVILPVSARVGSEWETVSASQVMVRPWGEME
jgi:hypothetical protein